MVLTLVTSQCLAAPDVLVPAGSTWKYLDNGSNQGTAWRAPGFDDTSWASGRAELGYGDGGEATVVNCGPSRPTCNSGNFATTYFRQGFSVADPGRYASLTLRLKRDDGAVVYLNGTQLASVNLPANPGYQSWATTAVAGTDEGTFFNYSAPSTALLAGPNLLAVEIHQSGATSSDISFDLELLGNLGGGSVNLTRGPYLQQATPTGLVVRWRTDVASPSRVCYGPAPNDLPTCASDPQVTSEHLVPLSSLTPATRYYYAVGTTSEFLAGADTSTFFETPPLPGTPKPTRVWVLGDSGTANSNAAAVRDAYLGFTGSRATDLWLMLGDNAYNNGTDAEYQAAVFAMYPQTLKQSPLWPTLGNHDGYSASSSTQTGVYYDIFTLPKQGEAGGVPSGTEAYYSFDYANIHFIVLDSHDTNRSAGSPMLLWLEQDLKATGADWIIAFWHHPPYTKGSHDSDSSTDSSGRMGEMRRNVLPILEAYGVDLVLSGHSHSYERSYLIDGHYGLSSTFTEAMKLDGGSGREDGSGAYEKPAVLKTPHAGAVYTVAGSSGLISGGSLNHPVMFLSLNELGSLVLDVDGDRLDARFINASGVLRDSFTLLKVAQDAIPPTAPAALRTTAVTKTSVSLAWDPATDNVGVSGYQVYRNGQQVAALAGLAFTDSGLSTGSSYDYQVRALDAAGNRSEPSATLSVTTPANQAPLASFTATPTAGTVPLGVTFDASASLDSDGSLVSYLWSFGDGASGSGVSTSHSYGAPGSYSATLTVTDNDGATTSTSILISVAAGPVTLTLTSIGAEDGWVLESSATSGLGGSLKASDTSSSALRVGDDKSNRQYRSVLSFDTSAVPATALIQSATLRLKRGSLTGTNPFTTHGELRVDLQDGGIGGNVTLATGDFQAPVSATAVASLSNAANNGDWSTGSLSPAGIEKINRGGRTQLRLYFETGDNNDRGNDYLGYYSGENATAANRPQLVISYQP